MSASLRMRIQVVLAVVGLVLAVMSLVWPTWWESVFEQSPDGGSGSWERLLALVWLGVAALFGWGAARDRRRVRASTAPA